MRIFQGENPDAEQNIEIGRFRVEGLSKAPAGNEVLLDLALDRDGILHVTAREKRTGLERRISIDQAVSRYEAAELQQARERIGALFGESDGSGTGRRRREPHRGRGIAGTGAGQVGLGWR